MPPSTELKTWAPEISKIFELFLIRTSIRNSLPQIYLIAIKNPATPVSGCYWFPIFGPAFLWKGSIRFFQLSIDLPLPELFVLFSIFEFERVKSKHGRVSTPFSIEWSGIAKVSSKSEVRSVTRGRAKLLDAGDDGSFIVVQLFEQEWGDEQLWVDCKSYFFLCGPVPEDPPTFETKIIRNSL